MSEEVGDDFDLVVIGSGPGGYVCAIRAAQLGLRVACVDKRGSHGGTCLNIGCIPSKALLHASEVFAEAAHAGDMGIQLGKPKLDLPAMMTYKENGIIGNTQGIDFLFKKNKVEALHGSAMIVASGKIEVSLLAGGTRTLNTKNIVIATGSESTPLQGVEIDEKLVVSSTGALEFDAVPKNLLIVGAGIIGLELGSVWARLGAEVTVVEFLDRITPGVDEEVAKQFQRTLQKQGFKFLLGKKVTEVKPLKASVKVTIEPAQSEGEAETLSVDKVLVSIGRRPYTEGLGLESVGVQLDVAGRIETNGFKTN
ncbi:MAG: FAD-dependent oxidoreductase, partial [Pseudomonadota bacterium]|nr:FAD-dependent oxidoreductase [Pseudomonadota bacterium]